MVSCNVFSTMHACIGDSTQLMTLPAAARSCQFIVNTLRHTNIVLDLLETTPIAELKARVADSEGIPPAKQRLLFGGRDLPESGTLAACRIVDDSIVDLALRLVGGMPKKKKRGKAGNAKKSAGGNGKEASAEAMKVSAAGPAGRSAGTVKSQPAGGGVSANTGAASSPTAPGVASSATGSGPQPLEADDPRLLEYWIGQLGGVGGPPPLELPTDRPRPQDGSDARPDAVEVLVPPELAGKLEAAGRETAAVMLLAAFQLLLIRHSRQDSVCVGTSLPAAKLSANSLPLPEPLAVLLDLTGKPTVAELLGRVRTLVEGARIHAAASLSSIEAALGVPAGDAGRSIFQAAFELQDLGGSGESQSQSLSRP